MSGDRKRNWKLLACVAALGLASLACNAAQMAQKSDCEDSGGLWLRDSQSDDYYCENAGPEYIQKYAPLATTVAPAAPESAPTEETSASNIQETLPPEATAPILEPASIDPDSANIAGLWHGTAQWLCDTNPIWSTSLDFKRGGTVSATLSTPTDTAYADGSWVVSGNEISIQFENGLWVGTISGNTLSGTFAEENCSGVWSVFKD